MGRFGLDLLYEGLNSLHGMLVLSQEQNDTVSVVENVTGVVKSLCIKTRWHHESKTKHGKSTLFIVPGSSLKDTNGLSNVGHMVGHHIQDFALLLHHRSLKL